MMFRCLLWRWTLEVSSSRLDDDDGMKGKDDDFQGRISFSLSRSTSKLTLRRYTPQFSLEAAK